MSGCRKIAVAGNLLVDHIREIAELPGRSELTQILRAFDTTGGCVPNTGIDLARLDPSAEVEALGVVGDDADGRYILRTLEREGLRTDRILRRGQTAFTDVFFERARNCRTFFTFPGACDSLDIADIPVEGLDCDLFHIGYLLLLRTLDAPDAEYGTVMAKLLAGICKKGILTSVDVVSERSDRFRRVVLPALPWVDYLTVNELEAGQITGLALRARDGSIRPDAVREALDALIGLGVQRQVVIHAPEGAWGKTRSGKFACEASNRLPKGFIQGTTGAGDAFCAGVLYAALRGEDLADALVCGNAAAQLSLQSDTANGSMREMSEARRQYLESRK